MLRAFFWSAAALAALSSVVLPRTAAAQTRIALDLDYAGDFDERGVDGGTGGALRLGRELDLVILTLTPEIGGSYHAFAGSAEATHYSGFIGGRVGIGKIIEPSVFAHIGVGKIDGDFVSETGPALDFGVALDFTLLPILDLGAHAAYDTLLLDGGESFDWYRLGLHASVGF